MISVQDGHKIYIKKHANINVSKLFTHDFFNFLGIKGVSIHKVHNNITSEIMNDTSLPMPYRSETDKGIDIGNDVNESINNKVFTLPDPSIPHENEPITMKDFELTPIKGGGMLSNIGHFFSSFLTRTKTNIEDSVLKTYTDDANNNDIILEFDKLQYNNSIISLSEMGNKPITKTIYTLDILGGIDYLELENISKNLEKQMEFMEIMGVEIEYWNKENIYRIGDHYINFDTENIKRFISKEESMKGMNKLMEEIIGGEKRRIRGTREGRRK